MRSILIDEVEYQLEKIFDNYTIKPDDRLLLEAQIQGFINKENEKFVFLKCNSDSYLYYDDLDVLLQTAYIDWFNILDNWEYLWAIVVDGTFDFDEYCENQNL